LKSESDHRLTRDPKPKRKKVWVAALVVLIIVSIGASQAFLGSSKATSQTASSEIAGQPSPELPPLITPTLIYSPSQPTNADFNASGVNISEPANYSQLVQYTLGLINNDRNQSGIPKVTLSPVESGQQHADSLAYYGTFGHWDVQGYKPYMRYTLLGGGGYVEENVYLNYCTYSPQYTDAVFPTACNLRTIENGIANSESGLMHRDIVCCNNGHRDNILDAFHTSVSIGIAYNSTTDALYLVEDFENSYITSESLQLSGTTVTLQGSTQQDLTGWTGASSGALMVVYYDPTPVPINASELTISPACAQISELYEPAYCQYRGAYNPGTLVTEVFAPCPQGNKCAPTQYSYAQQWTQSKSGSFKIVLSIASFEASHGPGVYTLYLHPNGGTNETITSLSLFVPGT
jgi:hypothetical protein